jgi:hypothetical protein
MIIEASYYKPNVDELIVVAKTVVKVAVKISPLCKKAMGEGYGFSFNP